MGAHAARANIYKVGGGPGSILNPFKVYHYGVIAVTEGLEASSPIVSNLSSFRAHNQQGCNVMA